MKIFFILLALIPTATKSFSQSKPLLVKLFCFTQDAHGRNCVYPGASAFLSAALRNGFVPPVKIKWEVDSTGKNTWKDTANSIPSGPDSLISGNADYLLHDFPGKIGDSIRFRIEVLELAGQDSGRKFWSNHVTVCKCSLGLKIFLRPNPVQNQLQISAHNYNLTGTIVEIFDYRGNKAYQSNFYTHSLNVASLRQGMYLLKIMGRKGENLFSETFIKQ